MKGDDISERLLEFAVQTLQLVDKLPKSLVGRHLGRQFLRSGTSSGANYEEARGAESRADFIHKLGIAWKEMRESWYWLRLIHRSKVIKPDMVAALLNESNQMCAILGRSLNTAKKNRDSGKGS